MPVKNSDQQFINPQMGRFNSTQWSLALAAAERSTPESENALGSKIIPPLEAEGFLWPFCNLDINRRISEVEFALESRDFPLPRAPIHNPQSTIPPRLTNLRSEERRVG